MCYKSETYGLTIFQMRKLGEIFDHESGVLRPCFWILVLTMNKKNFCQKEKTIRCLQTWRCFFLIFQNIHKFAPLRRKLQTPHKARIYLINIKSSINQVRPSVANILLLAKIVKSPINMPKNVKLTQISRRTRPHSNKNWEPFCFPYTFRVALLLQCN